MGAVPEIVIPDNVRTGITHPCYYEPDLNPTYQEAMAHYGTTVIPARVRKARDKDHTSYCTSFAVFDAHFGRSLKRLPGCTFSSGPVIGLKSSSPLLFAFRA
jgi:transposase